MIRIAGIGREGSSVVFEVEFDFRKKTHRLSIKKTVNELLAFKSREDFIDYVKKVVENRRAELFADFAEEFVPLNEDLEEVEKVA